MQTPVDNTNQPNNNTWQSAPTINFENDSVAPAPTIQEQVTPVAPNQNPNNNVTLGTTSNTTYISTISTPNDTTLDMTTPLDSVNTVVSNEQEAYINNLNVDGAYNRMEKSEVPEYINDPQVRENMDPHKKNTVPITKELKTVIIIAIVLLVFIFIMPEVFDWISNLRFN